MPGLRPCSYDDPRRVGPQVCRFLANPSEECYCLNVSSGKIVKMLSLCGGDFRSCRIYCARVGRSDDAADTIGDREESHHAAV